MTKVPTTIAEGLETSSTILARSSFLKERGSIEAESEWIVSTAIYSTSGERLKRGELYLNHLKRISQEAAAHIIDMSGARASGKPLQYLTGEQEFLNHTYEVGPGVLIPRPETELLVRIAIQELGSPKFGIEIGIGSGAISIELLDHFPDLEIHASDVSTTAKQLAEKNAKHILKNHHRLQIILVNDPKEVLEPFQSSVDFIISNPPYLHSGDFIDPDVLDHEPHSALFAPSGDPIYFYRRIAEQAQGVLKSNGQIFLEIPSERAKEIQDLFESFYETQLVKDLTGRNRILLCKMSKRGFSNG